ICHRIGDQAAPQADRRRTAPPPAPQHRPMLLGIDTSTHYASVALHDGDRLLAEHTWLAKQDHTRTLLPNIQRLFDDARGGAGGLTGVAVALGPGSFNGL